MPWISCERVFFALSSPLAFAPRGPAVMPAARCQVGLVLSLGRTAGWRAARFLCRHVPMLNASAAARKALQGPTLFTLNHGEICP